MPLGIDAGGKTYQSENWDEFCQNVKMDSASCWANPELSGVLNSEPSKNSELLKRGRYYGQPTRIGAELPRKVYGLYQKTRGDYPTPSGIIKKKTD